MSIYDDTLSLADQLSIAEKLRLIEHLSNNLRQNLEVEAFRQMPWQEFVDRTAGILVDDPIERPPQLPYDDRLELE